MVRLSMVLSIGAAPVVGQSKPGDEYHAYQAVVRRLIDRIDGRPPFAGPIYLYPYTLPQLVALPEDGNPVGKRLPAALLHEFVVEGWIKGLCDPAPGFKCKGVSGGVVILFTTIRWESPNHGRVVGQIARLPRADDMNFAPDHPQILGFELVRNGSAWRVSGPVALLQPGRRKP